MKNLERWGRQLLARAISLLLGVQRRPVALPESPKILVIRLDERIGNLLLLVPLLDSLRQRFPSAHLELLASVKGSTLLNHHPCVDTMVPFRKRALLDPDGPLRTPFRLRRRRYDLAIDAANPVDPSATQAILTRFSGATHTVGPDHPGFGRCYSARVRIPEPSAHEIDLRLSLLSAVPGEVLSRRVFLGELPPLPATSPVPRFIRDNQPFVVLNVGARVSDKMLTAESYMALVEQITTPVVLTFGPNEQDLASEVAHRSSRAMLSPPTGLWELAWIFRSSGAVITCDTGPMHLAVAVGAPTCGIFVSTDPARFGYSNAPHRVVDTRGTNNADWMREVGEWLTRR